MKFAVLSVPDFALHSLRRSEPGLCGRAVALVAGDGRKARITEASGEAHGVAPGLAATLAMSRCPGIILRPRDPSSEVESQRLLVAAAFTLSPRVEATGAGCCTIDLQGADPARAEALMRLRAAELAGAGLPARIGAGATPLPRRTPQGARRPSSSCATRGISWGRFPFRLRTRRRSRRGSSWDGESKRSGG